MPRKRWPDGAETQRLNAIQEIREARQLIRMARDQRKIDPDLVERMLADATTNLADAMRYLTEARLGVNTDEEE